MIVGDLVLEGVSAAARAGGEEPMSLSEISRDAVLAAIAECDRLGEEGFLRKYGFGRSRDYWLHYNGRQYPSKAIVGAAHGYVGNGLAPLGSDDFTGGKATVKRLLEQWPPFQIGEPAPFKIIPPEIGAVLTNDEVQTVFGVSRFRGMRKNNQENVLVLVSDPFQGFYDDRWEGDVLHYTGEGKTGDQKLGGQNRTLAKSRESGIPVYLFEVLDRTRYTFRGRVELVDSPYQDDQPDQNGDPRKVWMFPIQPISTDQQPAWTDQQSRALERDRQRRAERLSDDELLKRARAAKGSPTRRSVVVQQTYRDPAVAEYVKRQANGRCDLCHAPAPFTDRRKQPYLECHHIVWLAKGGADSIDNAVALCPNCHRKMHALNAAKDRRRLKSRVRERDRGLAS